jgi:D-alanyl-D-alanine carboxypeptidase
MQQPDTSKKILWAVFGMTIGIGGAFIVVQGSSAVYASVKGSNDTGALALENSQTAAGVFAPEADTQIPPAIPEVEINLNPQGDQTQQANTEIPEQIVLEAPTQENSNIGYPNEESVLPKKKAESCPKPSENFPDYSMANVNQSISIPFLTYLPDDLVKLPEVISLSKTVCLRAEAAKHLLTMITEAEAQKLKIRISSGFRSFDTQEQILKTWISIRGEEAYKRVAKPGYSEHQLGVAVDVSGASISYTSAADSFANSPEYVWLKANAYKYGFIESYKKDKVDVTGYEYEPWHYRYVGVDNAKLINDEDTTVTEFLANQEKTNLENPPIGG